MNKIINILNNLETASSDDFTSMCKTVVEEIDSLFTLISQTKNLSEASKYFEQLDEIQTQLAKLLFKKRIDLTNSLRKFVKDFDRIDDYEMRKYLYLRLKKDDYSLKF